MCIENFEWVVMGLMILVLLICGKLFDVVSFDGVWDFLVKVFNVEFVELFNVGCIVVGDDNDVFIDVVVDFVR